MTVMETRLKWVLSISSPDLGIICKKSPHLKIHGAYSKYVNMTATYINQCAGGEQIVPVTMFLVMLYNACFMYQKDKKSNLLLSA